MPENQIFFSVGNSDFRDHINRSGVSTYFVFIYFFRRTESIFNQKFFVFPQKCPFFHDFNFEDLSKAVTEFFFGRTPFELKPSIEYFWTYNAEINQRKPMPCFSIIWLQNQSLWCFFSTKHRNSFPLQFPILRFFVNFFWFIQSELVFQHPFATLRSDRGSLVYSCLRLHSASTWNLRTFLVARSFACYFQCINVGLGGSFAHCEILTMRFFGYAAGLACCLLLAWCNGTLVGESKVDTFHAFRRHSVWTQTK